MIRLPRKYLGIEEDGFTLTFKWADHTGGNETIEDFYLHGDSAPYGRFSYIAPLLKNVRCGAVLPSPQRTG